MRGGARSPKSQTWEQVSQATFNAAASCLHMARKPRETRLGVSSAVVGLCSSALSACEADVRPLHRIPNTKIIFFLVRSLSRPLMCSQFEFKLWTHNS